VNVLSDKLVFKARLASVAADPGRPDDAQDAHGRDGADARVGAEIAG
jgi:hypothetical protein